MSSLQFLNKKSWHVKTKKNEEAVWLREQAANKEAARIAELQKQLDEERKLEEVQRLERASGNSTAAPRVPRVNWMYEGPGAAMPGSEAAVAEAAKAKEAERDDKLLGKTDAVIGSAPAEMGDVGVEEIRAELGIRDAEAKLREDPLFVIRKKALEEIVRAERMHGGRAVLLGDGDGRNEGRGRRDSGRKAVSALRPPRNTNDELLRAEKKARKEHRALVREQRKLRREMKAGSSERVGVKRPRSPTSGGDFGGIAASDGRGLQDPGGAGVDTNARKVGDGFGLNLPARGTRVAVQKQFEPFERPAPGKAPEEGRPSSLPRRALSSSERAKKLATMEVDATEIEQERASKLRRHNLEEREAERRARTGGGSSQAVGGPGFIQDFARNALDKAESSRRGRERDSR